MTRREFTQEHKDRLSKSLREYWETHIHPLKNKKWTRKGPRRLDKSE